MLPRTRHLSDLAQGSRIAIRHPQRQKRIVHVASEPKTFARAPFAHNIQAREQFAFRIRTVASYWKKFRTLKTMNILVLPSVLLGTLILVSSPTFAEPPINQYLPPNQLYGPPNVQQKPSGSGSRPGGQFGQGSNFGSNQYLPPNQQYGPSSAGINGGFGGGYDDGSNNTPAKYEFEYTVNDPPSSNNFGHKESRDGDFTRGIYFVLLPDGRRQMVEYEADQDGYRPKVTYTQVDNGIGGTGNYPGTGELSELGGYPSGGLTSYPNAGLGSYPSGSGGSPSGYPGSSSGGYPSGSTGQSGYRY